jgi:PAS domain-containing protein
VVVLVLLLIRDRQRDAQLVGRSAQVTVLARTTQELALGRLQAVERLLFAAQQDAPLAAGHEQLNGLVRGILVLQPGEELSFVAAGSVAPAELPLLLGAPRQGGEGEWILPVLRPGMAAGERPVAAALDPRLLLTVPSGAGAMLLSADGLVVAAAGSVGAELGRSGVQAGTTAEAAMRRAVPLGETGLVLVAVPPPSAGGTSVWLLALGAAGLTLLALAGWLLLRRRGRPISAAVPVDAAAADDRLRLALERVAAKERLLGEMLHGLDLGACLLDSNLRLLAWNDSFAALAGVSPQALRRGAAMNELDVLARAHPRDIGAIRTALPHRVGEVAERRNGASIRFRPDGGRVEDRWTWLEEGLLLTSRLVAEPAHEARPASALADLCAEELRKRLPLLLAAATAGDAGQARMEAHAMRGVAANFGLAALAESLSAVEAAARAFEMLELRVAARALPPKVDAALASLLSRAA